MIAMRPIREYDVIDLLNNGRFEGEVEGYVVMDGPKYLGHMLYRVDGAVKITVGQGWWPLGTEKSEWAGTLAEPSPYSIAAGGSVVRAFAAYGWGWGGTWQSSRDFMHFSVRTDGG